MGHEDGSGAVSPRLSGVLRLLKFRYCLFYLFVLILHSQKMIVCEHLPENKKCRYPVLCWKALRGAAAYNSKQSCWPCCSSPEFRPERLRQTSFHKTISKQKRRKSHLSCYLRPPESPSSALRCDATKPSWELLPTHKASARYN